jgi:hypothetical protein
MNEELKALGFIHKGEFEPIEFDADDFNHTCEIGCWIIAIQCKQNSDGCDEFCQPFYIALLDYSKMEYWEIADGATIRIELDAIAAISEYEIKRVIERSNVTD